MSRGVGHRCSSDPALLRLWCRPPAAAPIRPLAWEPLYSVGAAIKRKKKNKKRSSLVVQQVKDPALSLQLGPLLWCGFSPWPSNIHMLWAVPKNHAPPQKNPNNIYLVKLIRGFFPFSDPQKEILTFHLSLPTPCTA